MSDVSRMLALARTFIGSVGIFIGFFFWFSGDYSDAISVVAVMAVGFVGIIAFISHVIFAKSDAARLGWANDKPYWQYEVGFANLSIAAVTLIAWTGNWGTRVLAVLILCFALYLLQAGLLHGRQAYLEKDGKLRGRAMQTLFFSVVMIWFGLTGVLLV